MPTCTTLYPLCRLLSKVNYLECFLLSFITQRDIKFNNLISCQLTKQGIRDERTQDGILDKEFSWREYEIRREVA